MLVKIYYDRRDGRHKHAQSRKCSISYRRGKQRVQQLKEGESFMQYTMYYEEQQKIDYDEYGRLKQQLLQKEENQKFEKIYTAKTQIQRG